MPLDRSELIAMASLELARASSPYFTLDLAAPDALAVVGLLQLATRHPALSPAMRSLAHEIADVIECQLAALGPCVREVVRRGWDPANDQELN